MKVEDIMTRDAIKVTENISLREAAGLLAKFRVHGLPVVDEQNKLIGIVTEGDFFSKDSSNIFLPTFLDFINGKKANSSDGSDYSAIEKKTMVGDIMTRECFSVRPELTIEELIQYIKVKNFNSMPVVGNDGVLLGIVSIIDVIKLL